MKPHTEEAIEPELPILDAHHHVWDDLSNPLATHYPLDSLLGDLRAGHNIVASVYAECSDHYRVDGPEELRPVGETEAVAAADAPPGVMAAIVGYADMRLGRAVRPVLEAHREVGRGRFSGIRHSTAWDPHPDVPNTSRLSPPGLLVTPSFVDGVRMLGELGMTFDAWMYFHQLPELMTLARRAPNTQIIVDHLGGPAGIGYYATHRDEMLSTWRRNISALALMPNVAIKIGGLGFPWFLPDEVSAGLVDSDAIAEYWRSEILHCIDSFGPGRCMFESDFPVDGRLCDYVTLWNSFKKASSDLDPSERDAVFRGSAARIYRIDTETGGALARDDLSFG
ncbi:MAG: amidohydrolase family protein [Microbacteriaceae bacterium]|nr:amidohydrolase family protein [Microbacteriaceae bacterium]